MGAVAVEVDQIRARYADGGRRESNGVLVPRELVGAVSTDFFCRERGGRLQVFARKRPATHERVPLAQAPHPYG